MILFLYVIFLIILPGRGSRNGASRVHQNTPTVACGLVALDGLVKASRPTVGDENGLTRILQSLFHSTLSLLVTRGNFL